MSGKGYLYSSVDKEVCSENFQVTCDRCVVISSTVPADIPILRRVGDAADCEYKPFMAAGEPIVVGPAACPIVVTLPGYYMIEVPEGTEGNIYYEEVSCKPGNFSLPTSTPPVQLDPASIDALCECINTSLEMTLNVELTPENKDLLAQCIAEALAAAELTFTLENVAELASAICDALAPKLEALGATITAAIEAQTAALLLAITAQTLELCEKFEDLNTVLCDKIEEQTAALCEKLEGQLDPFKTTCPVSGEEALRVEVCPEVPAPIVTYDYEFECVDGQLAVITTTTTDGVAVIGSPVPIDPAVDCTNADDFELVTLCAADGFVHVYAYDKSDLSTIVADVVTSESCEVCQPFDIVDYWKIEGGVPGVNGSRWRANSAPHGPVDAMFDGCGNHINGDADEVIVYPNWNVVDTPTRFPLTGSDFGTSQEYYHSWVYFPQGVVLEDNNGNTGEFINAYVGGKDQKPVFQKSVANTSASQRDLGTIGSYPAGLYQVAVELSDFSVYGGVNLRQSVDGGKTFTAIPAANIYSEPPTIKCVKVRVNCDGTMQTLDGLPFNPDAPNCSECEIKCPVIEDTATPPDYEFQTVLGCDDVDGDPDNFVNVTQETLIVDGVKTVTFYTDYGTDTQTEYTLQGLFVDCATGVPIEEPPVVVDCADWEILTVFDAIGTNGVNVERWNTNAITGEPSTTVPSDVFTGAPDYSGMPAHDNGAPDGPIVVESDLLVLDQVNDQSQMRGWTYIYTTEAIRLREFHGRAEAVDYFLGECCASPVKVATGEYLNNDVNDIAFDVSLPAGIHYVGFEVFDFSAYSGVDYQYSTDNGATWARVPAAWLYSAKPNITSCAMKVCPETGLIADIRTGVLNTTASLCEPNLCGPVFRSDVEPESRDICLDIGGGTVLNAYAILCVSKSGTELLRYEDGFGNEVTGTPVNCTCDAVDIPEINLNVEGIFDGTGNRQVYVNGIYNVAVGDNVKFYDPAGVLQGQAPVISSSINSPATGQTTIRTSFTAVQPGWSIGLSAEV